jgi:glycine/D-amino acid oxidase-like deaminating enzyme
MESLWIDQTPVPEYPRLEGAELLVDVAVVGGGIAGLLTAYRLWRRGAKVALLEARRLVSGETGHTTAHLTALHDTPFQDLERKFGREASATLAQLGQAAIATLETIASEHGIDCDLLRLPAYVYAEGRRDLGFLEKELEACRRAGLAASWADTVPLPFRTHGAIRFEDQGRFHPRKLLVPLAAQMAAGGVAIFERSRVVAVEDGTPCEVRTQTGRLHATRVVVVTDSIIQNRVLLQTKLAPYRTYALAAAYPQELPGLFYDTADPYH